MFGEFYEIFYYFCDFRRFRRFRGIDLAYFEVQLRTTPFKSSLKSRATHLKHVFKVFILIFCVVPFLPQINSNVLQNLIWNVSKVKPSNSKSQIWNVFAFIFTEKVWMLHATCISLATPFMVLVVTRWLVTLNLFKCIFPYCVKKGFITIFIMLWKNSFNTCNLH